MSNNMKTKDELRKEHEIYCLYKKEFLQSKQNNSLKEVRE
jgi:hypothetical protein